MASQGLSASCWAFSRKLARFSRKEREKTETLASSTISNIGFAANTVHSGQSRCSFLKTRTREMKRCCALYYIHCKVCYSDRISLLYEMQRCASRMF